MTWPIVPIGDLVTIRGGGTPSRGRSEYFKGNIPWVTPKDMKSWEISDSQIRITREAIEDSAANLLPTNTVLLVVRSGVLKHTAPIAINRRPVAINQDMKSLECGQRILPDYLARFIKSAEPTILTWVRATTADNYPIEKLRALPVPLPPLDEQRRIAAILDQADKVRRQRRQSQERSSQIVQAIFREMFGDWSSPGHNLKLTELGQHLDFLTSGSRGWAGHYSESGSLFLRIQNVRYDQLDLNDVAYVRPPGTAEARRTKVQAGDVLLSITADLGRTAVIPNDIGDAYINQHLSILRTNDFEPRFLSAALSSPAGQRSIQAKNREGVKAGLNFDDIRSLKIPDANRDLQAKFGAMARFADRISAAYEQHAVELEHLFSSLQVRAFSRGDVVREAAE